MNNLIATYLGRTDYKEIWDLQKRLLALRIESKIPDILLLNEHDHVYTIGKSGSENHLLTQESELIRNGIKVYFSDRGGDITYHGPGQIVVYPIVNLKNYYLDIHRYLRDLESVIISVLKEFNITGTRSNGYTGVWVDGEKIASIGIRVKSWVTMHGVALNVNTNISYFDRIIPCGIFHKGVTSMNQILRFNVDMDKVTNSIVSNFERIFEIKINKIEKEKFFEFMKNIKIRDNKCLEKI